MLGDNTLARKPLNVFLIAGEPSGDALGGKLMAAFGAVVRPARFSGIGGPQMEAAGLHSLFPMQDIAVMGFVPVVKRLPLLLRRIREAARAVIAQQPDVLVLIDAPDFTHRVAKIVRRKCPSLPIVDYVSPTIWAWRPGRARKMRRYVDHVLALLPFEPAAHVRFGGPNCTYIGHPLLEQLPSLRPQTGERSEAHAPLILILPGSRRAEITHLLPVFRQAVEMIAAKVPQARFVLPAVAHLAQMIRAEIANWPIKPEIVEGEEAKRAAFRAARVALAASGTVSLELALAQVPMVIAYRGAALEAAIARRLVLVPSVVLPNLIVEAKPVPEFLQEACTPDALAQAVLALVPDGASRSAQLNAFAEVETRMAVPGGNPSQSAAEMICKIVDEARHGISG